VLDVCEEFARDPCGSTVFHFRHVTANDYCALLFALVEEGIHRERANEPPTWCPGKQFYRFENAGEDDALLSFITEDLRRAVWYTTHVPGGRKVYMEWYSTARQRLGKLANRRG